MLKMRLQRVGKKNDASFRVVVTDSKRGVKSGDNVEILGSYNPHTNTAQIKGDRVKYWISVGAGISDTLNNLLINQKIIEGKKVNVLSKKSPIEKTEKEEEKKTEPKMEDKDEKTEPDVSTEESKQAEEKTIEETKSETAPEEKPEEEKTEEAPRVEEISQETPEGETK